MVSPTTPVPVMVGVLSLVMLSPAIPLSLAAANAATGAAEAVVSIVIGNAAGALVLPAGSVAVTLRLLTPCGSGLTGVAFQLPLTSTTAEAITLPLGSLMVMVSPTVPVPLKVGVLSLVVLSPCTPVSLLGSSKAVGAAGALVSIVTLTVAGALVLPAGSVAVTCKALGPSGSALLGVIDQLPAASTTAVPNNVVPSAA